MTGSINKNREDHNQTLVLGLISNSLHIPHNITAVFSIINMGEFLNA